MSKQKIYRDFSITNKLFSYWDIRSTLLLLTLIGVSCLETRAIARAHAGTRAKCFRRVCVILYAITRAENAFLKI